MEKVDIVIIGCGVVGLAVAAEISDRRRKILVLERNGSFGEETSSRNSEVIHAGIYYPAGSWKARLCVEGRQKLYALSAEYGIPTKNLGKVIVARNSEEEKPLNDLLNKGYANGVDDLRLISKVELKRLEPHVAGSAALLSPSTGIIDSHRLMQFFLGQAQSKHTDVVFCSPVSAVSKEKDGYRVTVGTRPGDSFSFHARVVINSAGLSADKIASYVGIDIDQARYRLKYCKGEYFRLRGGTRGWVKRLVYPVPSKESLGIHITPDLEGGLRLGPGAEYVSESAMNYDVNEDSLDAFSRATKRLLPMLSSDKLIPDTAGIRPKLQGPGDPFRDFVIEEESSRGFPGFINLIGIDSPGLTSAPAIARIVAQLVEASLQT